MLVAHLRRLRETLASDGRRTYRLSPGAPEITSHAEDIFARIFGEPPGPFVSNRTRPSQG
ncbi:hypothetical protein [Nocardia paucivorans]|uniref:hypothetical protein n=1 Tax=Nocardia paucivorans TaxID=114259 RepID=UPI000313A5BC|nr:hypothetical protein [Nocardia paucivorans]